MTKPEVSTVQLTEDMKGLYDLEVSNVKTLESYDDTMFLFTGNVTERYIAKYYNTSLTSQDILLKIIEVLLHLKKFNVPKPIQKRDGDSFTHVQRKKSGSDIETEGYLVVFGYIAGSLLLTSEREPAFWRKLGKLAAEICDAMSEVKSEDFVRHHPWDPLEAHKSLNEAKEHFPSHRLSCVDVSDVVNSMKIMEDKLKKFPKQFIHGDLNEYNVIVGNNDEIGIIDFNDMICSYIIFDMGHCIGYMIGAHKCDLQVGRYVYEGYSSVIKLSEEELRVLYDVIIARFTLSVTLGNQQIKSGIANAYVTKCVEDNIVFLKTFSDLGRDVFNKVVLGM